MYYLSETAAEERWVEVPAESKEYKSLWNVLSLSVSTHSALGEGFTTLEVSGLEAELVLEISKLPVDTLVIPCNQSVIDSPTRPL